MVKNITFKVDEELIARARAWAKRENTSLNAEFRRWLARYADLVQDSDAYSDLMAVLDYVRSGGSFSREEFNEGS